MSTAEIETRSAPAHGHRAWRWLVALVVFGLAALGVVEALRVWDAIGATPAPAQLQLAYRAAVAAVLRALTP